jgi:hypothetical protein
MMPTETIGLVMEKMRKIELCAIGAEGAGEGSLVDLALEGIRHPLQPDRRKAECFRLCLRERGRLRGGGLPGGGLRGHDFSLWLLLGLGRSLAQNGRVEQAINRFALAIGAVPMLETARIGGDA